MGGTLIPLYCADSGSEWRKQRNMSTTISSTTVASFFYSARKWRHVIFLFYSLCDNRQRNCHYWMKVLTFRTLRFIWTISTVVVAITLLLCWNAVAISTFELLRFTIPCRQNRKNNLKSSPLLLLMISWLWELVSSLPQSSSSVPSPQSFTPSQSQKLGLQKPFLHLIWVTLQTACMGKESNVKSQMTHYYSISRASLCENNYRKTEYKWNKLTAAPLITHISTVIVAITL